MRLPWRNLLFNKYLIIRILVVYRNFYVKLFLGDNKLIKDLEDKHKAFIGNRKDQITSAKAEGFKDGLLWAIETAKEIIEQEKFEQDELLEMISEI